MGKRGKKVKVRLWARFLPGILWALIIDGLDLIKCPLVGWIPVLAEIPGVMFDAVQGSIAYAIYDEPMMWVVGTALDLPATEVGCLDGFMPSYTITYLGLVKT